MVDWANRMQSADPDHAVDETAMQAARDEALAYFQGLVERRRAEPTGDLTTVLATSLKDGRPLTADELSAYFILLVAAGNETVRHLVSGGIVALDSDPTNWTRLQQDPTLINSTAEEMFRFITPVSCMRRTATEDMTLHGTDIAQGDKVVLWFSSANRDEQVFDDPDSFRIDRNPTDHLAFGWGVHFCLGAHLARAEVRPSSESWCVADPARGDRRADTSAPQPLPWLDRRAGHGLPDPDLTWVCDKPVRP